MPRNKAITEFRNRGETGNMLVAPPEPFFRGPTTQRLINGFGGDENLTGFIDVNNRALELLARDFGKSVRDFLIRSVLDFARGNFAPALDPAPTEMTFAVPNHERLRGWI